MYTDSDLKNLAEEYIEESSKALENNNIKESIELTQNALQVYKQLKDVENVAISYNRLGVLFSVFGNFEMAVDSYLDGLDVAMKNNLEFQVARIQNNIGSRYQELQQYNMAISYFKKAGKYFETADARGISNYAVMCLVLYMNLAETYCLIGDYKNAQINIIKAQEYFEISGENEFEYSLLMIKCHIMWHCNEIEYVRENIDKVVEGIISDIDAKDFEESIRKLCGFLEEMSEFEKWETVLIAFETFADIHEDVYFLMVNAELWCDYYKAIGDTDKYALSCVDHFEFYLKYEKIIKNARAESINQKISYKEKQDALEEAEKNLHIDLLTGLGDRKKLERDYQGLLAKYHDDDMNISLGIVDIDYFKLANEVYGHKKCDEILTIIADFIQNAVTECGNAYRFGGDEFVVLFTGKDRFELAKLAETIRDGIADIKIENKKSPLGGFITVSQGYSCMSVERNVTLDQFISYAETELNKAQAEGCNDFSVIDSSRKDYRKFYNKYVHNMDVEVELEKNFRNARTKEEWIANLEQREAKIDDLFKENEKLVNKYVIPLLSGIDKLDEDNSAVILSCIMEMYTNKRLDFLVMVTMAEYLEGYFEKMDYMEEHISVLCFMVEAYKKLDHKKYYDKIISLISKLDKYRSYYDRLHRTSSRRMLAEAYYNAGLFKAESENTSIAECLEIIKKDLSFFDDSIIASRLRMSDESVKNYIDFYKVKILYRKTRFMDGKTDEVVEIKEVYEILVKIYAEYIKICQDAFDLDPDLFFAYQKVSWLTDRLNIKVCFENLKSYYEKNKDYEEENEVELAESRKFKVMLVYIPELIKISKYLLENHENVDDYYIESLIEQYVKYVKNLPKFGNADVIDSKIYESLQIVIQFLPDYVDPLDLLFQIVVERDIDVTLHSYMVSEIGKLIVEMVYRNKPELFRGSLGFEEDQEVIDNWPKIQRFIERAGMIHDIGKINVCHIIKKNTRTLNDLEIDNVNLHPEFGAQLCEKSQEMKDYIPMILGHHKSWDDSFGFPENYNYTDNPEPFLVSILQIADTLDVATTHGGHISSHQRTIEEVYSLLKKNRGTRFNPAIVDMISNDKEFKSKYEELVSEGRTDICFEIYNSFLDESLAF